MKMKPYKNLSKFWFNVLATGNACLGFTYFGYNIAISNSVGPYTFLNVFIHQKNFLNTLLWCAPFTTAAIATLATGGLALKLGRRRIMMISDVFGIIGVLLTFWPHYAVVLVGRLIMGIPMGVTSVAASQYFTEITPTEYRGELTNGPTVFSAIGILIATLLCQIVPNGNNPKGVTNDAWRPLLALGMIPSILRLIGFMFFFRYETPYYYVNKRKYDKAARCLLDFYNGDIVERVREIVRERDYMQKKGQVKLWELGKKRFRRALLASMLMFSLEYLSAFNLILTFTGRIYGEGIGNNSRYGWLPGLLGVTTATVNLCAAVVSIWTTSRFGRRPLVVYGAFLTGLCCLLYGILARTVGTGNLAPKIFLVLWPIPWNLSLGSVIVVITSETLPDIGVSIAIMCGWIFGYLTFQFFPKERDGIGRGWTFIIYGIITMIGSLILWAIVIETRGKTKDQILKEYSGKYHARRPEEIAQEEEEDEAADELDPNDAAYAGVYKVIEKDEEKKRRRLKYGPSGEPPTAEDAREQGCDVCDPHRKYLNRFRRSHISRKRKENERNVQAHQDRIEQKEVLAPEVIQQIRDVEENHDIKMNGGDPTSLAVDINDEAHRGETGGQI